MIQVGREVCGHFERAVRRERLITNDIGGYALGTLSGANSRRYHGLLVASLNPPLQRTVLVAQLEEQATLNGQEYPLSTNEFHGRYVHLHGYLRLKSFRLEGTVPTLTYALAEVLCAWMALREAKDG
jgi:predicted glycogen debranching enzyme